MEDSILLVLNRLSIAVQFAVVMCLFAYFLLLGRMIKLQEARLWLYAWLADAIALAAVFIHIYADIPFFGHRIALIFYLAGKATFAILIIAGARHHLRPKVEPPTKPVAVIIFVAIWSLSLGLAVPSLWQAQLAESMLVAGLFLAGGVVVLRHPRSKTSRWLGWALLFEGALFLYSAVLLAPGLWGNQAGFAFLNYSSFFDAWAELMLALACIAVLADRREEHLNYANRELLESKDLLSRLVDTDPLTNLSNRRGLRKVLDSAIDTGGAIIFIDINRFKQVNDLFGHRIGDETLRHLAEVLTEQFRPEDHVIRWGGDEFLIVAPGMDLDSASIRIGAIRRVLRSREGGGPLFSIAVGVAEVPPGGDATAALEEADRRMYAEKKGT